MTHEQHIASSHWSMYAIDGFPIRKLSSGEWLLSVRTAHHMGSNRTFFAYLQNEESSARSFQQSLLNQVSRVATI